MKTSTTLSASGTMLGIILILSLLTGSYACPDGCDCTETGSVGCVNIDAFPDRADIPSGTMEIRITNSQIDKIENLPDYGAGLENLFVVNSGVTEIEDGAFSNLTGLKNLMLNGNKIMEISAAKFTGLGSLVELNLGNNLIKVLPNSLLNTLPSLLKVDLNSNHMLMLEETCFEGSNIMELDLGNCGLGMVDSAIFSKATKLEWLNLDRNPIGKLTEDNFKGMGQLRNLYLAACGLTQVDEDAFDDLSLLEELDLSFNHLTELDEDVLNDLKEKLKTLRLDHNNLTTLDHDFAEIQTLFVGENPWECGCELGWMKEITLQKDDNPVCHTPPEFHGESVVNATSTLDCPCGYKDCEKNSNLALYIAIPVVVILVLLVVFFIFMIVKNRREKAKRKSVKYSAVYKDTVEAANKPV